MTELLYPRPSMISPCGRKKLGYSPAAICNNVDINESWKRKDGLMNY